MRLPILLSFLTRLSLSAAAQPAPSQVRVVDANTQQPIPYASAGVPGKALGTVADAQGQLRLAQMGAAQANDTVVVSCVGYRSRRLPLAQLARLAELPLQPQAQGLGEVVVRAGGWKRRRVGRTGAGGFTYYNFHLAADKEPANKLGREVGAILPVRANSFIEDVHVFIRQSQFQHLRFRLNVRTLDAQGLPAGSLLSQDVQFTLPDSTAAWQPIDLRPLNVNVGQR